MGMATAKTEAGVAVRGGGGLSGVGQRSSGNVDSCSNKDLKCVVVVVVVVVRCPYLLGSHVWYQFTRYEYFFLTDYYYAQD